jgi:hypothetical protein
MHPPEDECCDGCFQLAPATTDTEEQLDTHHQHLYLHPTQGVPLRGDRHQAMEQQLSHSATDEQQLEPGRSDHRPISTLHKHNDQQPAAVIAVQVAAQEDYRLSASSGHNRSLLMSSAGSSTSSSSTTSSSSSDAGLKDAHARTSHSPAKASSPSRRRGSKSSSSVSVGKSNEHQASNTSSHTSVSAEAAVLGMGAAAAFSQNRKSRGAGSSKVTDVAALQARQESNDQASTSGRWVDNVEG